MQGAETGDLSEVGTAGTGLSADSATFQSIGGAYAYKLAGNFGSTVFSSNWVGGTGLSRVFGRCFFRFDTDTAPAGNIYAPIIWIRDTTGNTNAIIVFRQLTDATYRIGVFNSLLVETQTVWAPVKNTWYLIEFDITKGAGTGAVLIYIDGTLLVNLTSGQYGANNNGSWSTDTATNNAARNIWLDDLEIDDAALPGRGYIIARQFKQGTPTYDTWTKTSSQRIDQVWSATPFSAANNASSIVFGDAQTAMVALLSSPQTGHGLGVIGSNDTINGVKAGVVGKATLGSGVFLIRVRSGGVDTDLDFVFTTTDAFYEIPIFTDTLDDLNNSEVGAVQQDDTQTQTVEDAWLLVSYTPSAADIIRGQGIF